MIQRPEYLKELKKFKDKELIKVITGIRRCGKSTLLEMYRKMLVEDGISSDQIININLEDLQYNFIENYMDLYNYINNNLQKNKKNYIFIDEIQKIPEFQKVADSLYINKNVDLYITGSNANLLSSELSTLLTGRYVEIKMLPLSFKEYVSAFPNNNNYYQLFLEYMRNGGMPGNLSIIDTNPNDIDKYMDGIFSTIVYKDIMARNNITDKILLENILKFIYEL